MLFSRRKRFFQTLTLKRTLVQGNYYRRTHLVTRTTCKTRLIAQSTLLTTRSTGSTRLSTRSTRLSTRSTRLSTRSSRLSTRSTRFSTRRTRLSTCSICPFTCSTWRTICLSFITDLTMLLFRKWATYVLGCSFIKTCSLRDC